MTGISRVIYYGRLMSVALSDSIDLSRESVQGLRLTQSVSLSQLPRLVEALRAGHELPADALCAKVQCHVEIGNDGDKGVVVRARISAPLTTTCQRCLGPMTFTATLSPKWRSGKLPDGDFELGGEPIRLIDWVEDELLLALPAIPKHADRADCEASTTEYLTASDEVPMRTPFADLKKMLDERKD